MVGFDIGEGEALAHCVAVGAAGGEADNAPARIDRLVAVGIGVLGVHREVDQAGVDPLGGAPGEGVLVDERPVAFDESLQAGLDRRDLGRQLLAPRLVGFFHAQRADGVDAEIGDAVLGAGGKHGVVERFHTLHRVGAAWRSRPDR